MEIFKVQSATSLHFIQAWFCRLLCKQMTSHPVHRSAPISVELHPSVCLVLYRERHLLSCFSFQKFGRDFKISVHLSRIRGLDLSCMLNFLNTTNTRIVPGAFHIQMIFGVSAEFFNRWLPLKYRPLFLQLFRPVQGAPTELGQSQNGSHPRTTCPKRRKTEQQMKNVLFSKTLILTFH